MDHSFSPALAFCPLRIMYYSRETDKKPVSNLDPSLEDLQTAFETGRREWEASDDCSRLCAAVERAPSLAGINKIVAFACSSMCYPSVRLRNRSITQHAAILTLTDLLHSKKAAGSETNVQCFAQDPAYTDIDKTVLQRTGIMVLDDPRGFCEVDDNSIVLSVCPNVPVRQIIIDIVRPAIMIWDKVLGEEEMFTRWADRLMSTDSFPSRNSLEVQDLEGFMQVELSLHFFFIVSCLVSRASVRQQHILTLRIPVEPIQNRLAYDSS